MLRSTHFKMRKALFLALYLTNALMIARIAARLQVPFFRLTQDASILVSMANPEAGSTACLHLQMSL